MSRGSTLSKNYTFKQVNSKGLMTNGHSGAPNNSLKKILIVKGIKK